MGRFSIRLKITIWFTAALVVIVLFAYLMIFVVSRQILIKTIQDSLVETVENNVDEIEYFSGMDEIRTDADIDYLIDYRKGYLEIDDDFLSKVNEVYTGLYDEKSRLIYGENPIAAKVADLEFVDSEIQKVMKDGTGYYIFDRKLTAEGLNGLWLRGVVSEEQGERQSFGIMRIALVLLPVLVVIASAGGYFIAGRTLNPIQKIAGTARKIGEENDLKCRINLGKGNDELHQLADIFNEMFERLESTFEKEQQFTSDVSHELRTPMAVISAQCEYTLEKERSVGEYEDALRVIRRQARKMTKLIDHMLDFARLEMKSGKYAEEAVDMEELVASICSDMKLIREKEIMLDYETEQAVFYGNRELLSRILVNLVSNAYRYGKENGHIFVKLKKEETELVLSVTDDGIGIAEEEQEKIFWRFYQTDVSRGGEGSGLGLAMVYEIVKFYRGKIQVKSEAGSGSVFQVKLPL